MRTAQATCKVERQPVYYNPFSGFQQNIETESRDTSFESGHGVLIRYALGVLTIAYKTEAESRHAEDLIKQALANAVSVTNNV